MNERRGPQNYQLVLRGEISQRFGRVFDGMQVRSEGGQSVLTGPVVDQSHLHALIGQIGDLGIELVSVNPSADQSPKESP